MTREVGARARPRLSSTSRWLLLLLVAAGCWLLKYHYSTASSEQLRWILAPTAALVEAVTAGGFVYELGRGYVSTALGVVIAPACAGVNFLIVAWAALALGHFGVAASSPLGAWWLPLSALVAYATTLVVNAARILLVLMVGAEHRVQGTLLYLLALYACYYCAGRLLRGRSRRPRQQPVAALAAAATPPLCPRPGVRPVAFVVLPLVCYLGMTVLVPGLNGGWARADFWYHTGVVTSLALGASAALLLLQRVVAPGGTRRPLQLR